MATLSDLQAQRDALQEAISSGTYQVRHGDKSVMYQTTTEMLKALDRLDKEIADLSSKKRRRRYAYSSSKGL